MLAIRSPQALVEGPQVRGTFARPERVPVRCFSIFDDGAGGRRVVFIESDATSHVEKVPDRGSFVGCFAHLRDHGRDLTVGIENPFAVPRPASASSPTTRPAPLGPDQRSQLAALGRERTVHRSSASRRPSCVVRCNAGFHRFANRRACAAMAAEPAHHPTPLRACAQLPDRASIHRHVRSRGSDLHR